ncbi:hypothetical protein BCR42DRAFT_446584 [Absidia repens]|uniref:GAR domain-containing protein n=1 Tax=Absidia repens TaxID=90262 RepID=A0A1X2IZ98_9FUNG|nr:hypothetical protein BCR42DRAFT_446584 [Absidia repens]
MTSLVSSSLITLSNEALLPTVNDSSYSSSPPSNSNLTSVLRILSRWVNARIGNNTIEQFDRDFRDGASLNDLMTWLQQHGSPMPFVENNSISTRQDHLSNVARIIDTLLVYDIRSTNQYSSTLVNELESAISDGHVDITLELLSCIILNLWMKPILLNEHITTWTNQSSICIVHATTPTFRLHQLTFQHIYTEVGSALLSWVNWQLQNGAGKLGVDIIHDFGSSWKNGLAFTLLIYCQDESFLTTDLRLWLHQQLELEISDDKWSLTGMYDHTCTLLSLVFDIANKHMDVPRYLKPQDLLDADSVNEWCIILYVYEFYLYASRQQQQQSCTITISEPQSDIQEALMAVQSISHTTDKNGVLVPFHPLDTIDDSTIDLYSQHVSKVRSMWRIYPEKDRLAQQNPQQVMDSIDSMNRAYDLFTNGLAFSKISHAIQAELQVVENDTKSTMTADSIQQLESRMRVVQSSLSGMEEEFSTLLEQPRYSDHLRQIHDRYQLVCEWVDQVRLWMTEADRIRGRIGNWIDLIHDRNSLTNDLQLNALTVADVTALDHLDVMTLYNEHEQLKRDIERFEADDMKRLRTHVKQRTNDQDEHRDDLTPADTSTIEITLITINLLHRLLQLMTDRGQWIECLVRRLKWEHLFEKGVEWIFAKDNELEQFFHGQALWRDEDDDGFNILSSTNASFQSVSSMESTAVGGGKEAAEQIIGVLIQLEQDIAGFDRGLFMDVLDAYQEMEGLAADSGNETLPSFLDQRQTGFEGAFEDLMKRCSLARKVVEQHLIMMDIVAQYKNIKNNGEALRRRLLAFNDGLGDSDLVGETRIGNCINDNDASCTNDDIFANSPNTKYNSIESDVRHFKETSADFLAHAKTRIPYPDAPIMLTAMGANDSTDVGVTNDAILSALHTFGMSLALIADGLDQLLAERQHIHSLQRRVKHACEQLARFTDWMNDRLRMVEKSDFDIYINNDSSPNDMANFTSQMVQDKDEELVRLDKERDSIASRIQQMEHDELSKLLDSVNVLETDIDSANAVLVDRRALVNALQSLEDARGNLNATLLERAHKLDVLKKHLEWVTQWIKTHQWILSTIRKLWDFCMKKARYDPSLDHLDTSASGHRNLMNTLYAHQDRITDTGERQMTSLADAYKGMVDGLNDWVKTSSKQSMVVQKYKTLVHLSQYASKLVAQRSAVADLLVQICDASREGERLRDNFTKSIRRMMEHDHDQHHHHQHNNNSINNNNNRQTQQIQHRSSLQERVESFQHLITTIKRHLDTIGFPLFTARSIDPGFHSIFLSMSVQQSQQADIKNLLINKVDQLVGLDSLLGNLLVAYENAVKRKQLVTQYSENALELDLWIQEQITTLKNRHLDVAAETMDHLLMGKTWTDLDHQHQLFVSMVNEFETDQLKKLHDKVAALMDDTLASKSEAPSRICEQQQRRSVDMTLSVTQNFGTAIASFALLKQGITDEAITMDAVRKRSEWSDVLQDALCQLEAIQTRLSAWCKKKDQWIYTNGVFVENDVQANHSPMLAELYQDLEILMADKSEFTRSALPKVQQLYDTFIQCFSKLPRPAATPDHIESTMTSLDRSSNRCHESLVSKNRELDIIRDCICWDGDRKSLLLAIKNCRIGLEAFVSDCARWQPVAVELDQKKPTNGNHSILLDNSKKIFQQCTTADQQLHDLRERLDVLKNLVSANNINSVILKSLLCKLGQVEWSCIHVSHLAQFLDLVIKQNGMVQEVECRITEINGDLKLVLDEHNIGLLEINEVPGNDTAHEDQINFLKLSAISNHHARFTKDIDQLRTDASAIIYPVRPTIQQINAEYQKQGDDDDFIGDIDYDDRTTLDNVANTRIYDFITSGVIDLDKKLLDLGRIILASEEKSKWFATLQSFKQQLKCADDILKTQKTKLSDAIEILGPDLTNLDSVTRFLLPQDDCLSMVESALSSAEEVEKTLKSNYYLVMNMAALNDQCLNYMHTDLPMKGKNELQDLGMVYNRLLDSWKQLESKTSGTVSLIQCEICPSLVICGMEQLMKMLNCLELELESQHYSTVSDEQYANWLNKVQSLRQKYFQLRLGVCGGSTLSTTQLDDANMMIGRVEALLRTMKINMAQWQQIKLQHSKIDGFVDETMESLRSLEAFQQSIETVDFTDTTIDSAFIQQQLKARHNQIMDDVHRLEYVYSNLQDNYEQVYQSYDDEFQLKHRQLNMDRTKDVWKKLHTATTLATQRMNLMNKWLFVNNELTDARQTLYGCKTTLETVSLCNNKQTRNSSDDNVGMDRMNLIDNVEKQLNTILPWLTNLRSELDQLLLDDKSLHEVLLGRYYETLNLANQVEKLLQEHHLDLDTARLFQIYRSAIDQRQQVCSKQKSALEQYDEQYHQLYSQLQADGNSVATMTNMHNVLGSHYLSLDRTKDVVLESRMGLQSETGDIKIMYERLTNELGQSCEKMDDSKQPLLFLLDTMDDLLLYHERKYQFVGSVECYLNHTMELLNAASQLDEHLLAISTGDIEDYTEARQEHAVLKETIDLFTPFIAQKPRTGRREQEIPHPYEDSVAEKNWSDWLDLQYNKVMGAWTQCCDRLYQYELKLRDFNKQQNHVQTQNLIHRVNSMKDRVDALHLSGNQNIAVEYHELDDIEKEFRDTLCPRISTQLEQHQQHLNLDEIGSGNINNDDKETIQRLHMVLKQSHDDLEQAIGNKVMDARLQEQNMDLMKDIGELENVIGLMEEAVAAAAPHHCRIVDGAFVKSDLQRLLTGLVNAYKTHSQMVGSLFEKLHSNGKATSTATSVLDLITSSRQHWIKAKDSATARERELQTCIEELQHDFFTKLALIGKTQKQRHYQQEYSSPLPPSPISASFSYKVDRENSLDVQIGQVLKNQPYRLKVKMVPGQVGKYWIGNTNPRLVYCRILKSKVVMVRVGGGWVELSQYLLDHGCCEGTIIPGNRQTDINSRFGEAFVHLSNRSISPSGRVTLRGGGGLKYTGGAKSNESSGSLSPSRTSSKTSTSTRCRSPLAGYTDGDRYVRVDEAGNYLAMKMTRVDDDYFIPYQHTNKTF